MKLVQCRFSSGQRVPLLVYAGNTAPLPILVPFIYVQFKLRHRAYNTAAAHLCAIKVFYTHAKTRDFSMEIGFKAVAAEYTPTALRNDGIR